MAHLLTYDGRLRSCVDGWHVREGPRLVFKWCTAVHDMHWLLTQDPLCMICFVGWDWLLRSGYISCTMSAC
jgi:hypothetical protein